MIIYWALAVFGQVVVYHRSSKAELHQMVFTMVQALVRLVFSPLTNGPKESQSMNK